MAPRSYPTDLIDVQWALIAPHLLRSQWLATGNRQAQGTGFADSRAELDW
ncbi:hypothetical protein LX81_03941 [Palleronia aestuarii]|uniref:Uncharacterized protein n=1 Tax=Palleronia aestuarii TaxID=568105 RepID=A0A2W7MU46_9RHOB|nr:hypothetical protein LX81_03941 [Palleronia aestuarii]